MKLDTVTFCFDPKKNKKLEQERGVGFERIIQSIREDKVLDIREHPNKEKYSGQRILVVEIDDYAYQVPFVREGETVILKTLFPSRKATRAYLKKRVPL